jgi:hypothetical protein
MFLQHPFSQRVSDYGESTGDVKWPKDSEGREMSKSAEPVNAGAVLSATRYHEAAWIAFERRTAPPDPSSLSDHALIAMVQAMMQYETPSLLLPVEANVAVEKEWRRRGLSPEHSDRLLAAVMLAFTGVTGTVIGWALLAG